MLLSKLSRIGKKEQSSDLPKQAKKFDQMVDDALRIAGDVSKGIGQHVISSKRKKNAEQQLAQAFKDSVDKSSNEDKLFVHVVRESTDVMNNLSILRRNFEQTVEKTVVNPLQRLIENTRTDIDKDRRAFKKGLSETREARDQFERAAALLQSLTGHCNNGPAINLNGSFSSLETISQGTANSEAVTSAVTRYNTAQNTLDDKERDLAATKDKLLCNLYNFVGQEANHAELLLDYFRAHAAYLEESLQLVRKAIPDLATVIEQCKPLTVYQKHLPDHLAETNRSISYVLETCISRLDNEAVLQEEGLFRKSGSQKKTELLVKALNLMEADDTLLDSCDASNITGALKQYLNSLPEPLLTFGLAEKWAEASKVSGSDTLDLIEASVREMPELFRHNLAYLCLFLHKVASYSAVNKMTPDNLSIVLAPNLYRLPRTESPSADGNSSGPHDLFQSLHFLHRSGPGIKLVDYLIVHADTLFAQEKVSLNQLLKDHLSCSTTGTCSRSPSSVSLSDAKLLKPTMAVRMRSGSADESAHSTTEPVQHPPTITNVANASPAISSMNSNLSETNAGEVRLAVPAYGSPHTQKKLPRKKTIAPKPPIPPSLPQSLVLSTSSNREPVTQSNSDLEHQELYETSQVPTSYATEDQTLLPLACSPMLFPPSESPSQTDDSGQLKAPPKRPPRPVSTVLH